MKWIASLGWSQSGSALGLVLIASIGVVIAVRVVAVSDSNRGDSNRGDSNRGDSNVTAGARHAPESIAPFVRYGTQDPAPNRFDIVINTPRSAPRVKVGTDAETGDDVTVACQTCHATLTPRTENGRGLMPEQFHADLKFRHGNITCLACHDVTNYDRLHLADGKPVAFVAVMTLCAQCHAKRHNDYQHGAHGGMNGHWDLSRGGRTRKHCIDCHNPHWPQFPRMKPTFKPLDRFLTAESPNGSKDHE